MAVEVKPWFICKIKSVRGRLNHYTLLHRTSYKTVPWQHCLRPGVLVEMLILVVSNKVALWMSVQMTMAHRVCVKTVLKIFVEMSLISLHCHPVFLLKETQGFLSLFLTRKLLFEIRSSRRISEMEGTGTQGNRLLNLLRLFRLDFFRINISTISSPVFHCLHIQERKQKCSS